MHGRFASALWRISTFHLIILPFETRANVTDRLLQFNYYSVFVKIASVTCLYASTKLCFCSCRNKVLVALLAFNPVRLKPYSDLTVEACMNPFEKGPIFHYVKIKGDFSEGKFDFTEGPI